MSKNLLNFYNSLPKRTCPKTEFVRSVMMECKVSFPTVMNWISGKTKPQDNRHIEALSRLTGIPEKEIFV